MAKAEILLWGNGSRAFQTVAWVLEYKGFSIKAVRGAEAALEAVVKKNFDLIITKVARHDKDSLTALKQAKKINPLTKIILITDSLDLVFPLEAYTIGVDDYLIMPVSAGEFWQRVENCLEGAVIDLVPEASVGKTVAEEELLYTPLVRSPMVSATASVL